MKLKGTYETEKLIGNDIAYYKDNSFRIVAESVLAYFKDNIPIENTIHNCQDIFMFTGRQKFKSDSYGETRVIKKGQLLIEPQQKTTRYYISNDGRSFVKIYKKDNSEEIINKEFKVTIYNKHKPLPIKSYNIDYKFYIKEAKKLIEGIEGKAVNVNQLTFDF